MSIRDRLKKAAGLFVEFESDPGSSAVPASAPTVAPVPRKTVEDIVKETPGPNLQDIQAKPVENRPVFTSDGRVDFSAIYALAGLQPTSFGADEVLKILSELPAELPLETKRATMKVTLGAMTSTTGTSAETVVADASRKLAALASYSEGFEGQANEFMAKAENDIVRLQAEIERVRGNIDGARTKAEAVKAACLAESDRLDDVLEFFSLDVAPSKYAQ